MSLQTCLNCRELGLTWYVGDDDRTWWFCSECNFKIEEDESKECWCGECSSPLPFASWLIKDGEGFYWCFNCNQKTEGINKGEYQAWVEEQRNLIS